jgi:hypothetical protein
MSHRLHTGKRSGILSTVRLVVAFLKFQIPGKTQLAKAFGVNRQIQKRSRGFTGVLHFGTWDLILYLGFGAWDLELAAQISFFIRVICLIRGQTDSEILRR